jgi:hypothetical protein
MNKSSVPVLLLARRHCSSFELSVGRTATVSFAKYISAADETRDQLARRRPISTPVVVRVAARSKE